MSRPSIAIVGRPNVGKSSLFNALIGKRISIEDPTSGVTRDRVLHPLDCRGRLCDLIDTGGIGVVDRQDLSEDVENQISIALREAAVLVFLVDVREGIAPLDIEVAQRLRKLGKPVVLAANKADTDNLCDHPPSFHALGYGEVIPVSAKSRRGFEELLEAVAEKLPPSEPEPAYDEGVIKIALVGKRNAGKSSMVNAIVGQKRVIVSEKPGTTRDAVDIMVEKDGKRFVVIDTAGLRRKGKMDDSIEFFGQVRSERAIERADVVALLIDASEPVSKVDQRIGSLIAEAYKPCIIVINKWDLAQAADPNLTAESYHEYLCEQLAGLNFAPLVLTSAKTGMGVGHIAEVAFDLDKQAHTRVTTGQANRALQAAYERQRPPSQKGHLFKIYYCTQPETTPPTFIIFCNEPSLANDQYTRYMAGQLRNELGFPEIPIRLEYRSSHGGREGGGREGGRSSGRSKESREDDRELAEE